MLRCLTDSASGECSCAQDFCNMPPIHSKLGGSKVIHSQTREVVYNVYKYFRDVRGQRASVYKRVSTATGVSISTVKRIVKEAKSIEEGASNSFSTPDKERIRTSNKSSPDNFNEEVVRRTINNFYIEEKQRPTLKKIHSRLKEKIDFQGSISTLRKIILHIGFRWRKTRNNRKILVEQQRIKSLRCAYLRSIHQYRTEGRSIVYMDETYLHTTHTTPLAWSDESLSGLFSPVSKGQRLIIIHAGGEHGFVPNAYLRFISHRKTGDYHGDMDFNNYEQWLKERLIPNLSPHSVLVIDNAPYHNVQLNKPPTSNSRKDVMISWLQSHLENDNFEKQNFHSKTKAEIYELILTLKPQHRSYKIDHLLQQHGHDVLRLPPYHPELNPIELIWATVKNWVAENNVTFKMEDVMKITDEKFSSISAEEWKRRCQHVKNIEQEYLEREGLLDAAQELVIHLGGDSDASSESDSDANNVGGDGDDDADSNGKGERLSVSGVTPME